MKKRCERERLMLEIIINETELELSLINEEQKWYKKSFSQDNMEIIYDPGFDASIGVIFGLDGHKAWVEMIKSPYRQCSHIECNKRGSNAALCSTRNYRKCTYFKPGKHDKTYKFGITFSMNRR